MYKIILASESPRRKELMDMMEVEYITRPANIVEEIDTTDPQEMVKGLSKMKVDFIYETLAAEEQEKNLIIIGADTMVFHKGQALGKPKDEEDAKAMIRSLSGDAHEVCTGVYILIKEKHIDAKGLSFVESTKVYVEHISEEEIEWYVSTKEPMDKAGAYGIQGKFGIFIHKVEGDYSNVVGFPVARIYKELKKIGINIKNI